MGEGENWGWQPSGSPTTNLERSDVHWSHFDSSVNAVSFGFVATAVLISMFLVMAIFERFLRPSPPELPLPTRRDIESQLGFHPKLGYPSPKVKFSPFFFTISVNCLIKLLNEVSNFSFLTMCRIQVQFWPIRVRVAGEPLNSITPVVWYPSAENLRIEECGLLNLCTPLCEMIWFWKILLLFGVKVCFFNLVSTL